ncbi:MAG TPA: class I SAM-dependent methyltransferase [Solirubrobacteraceae bacterium]|nr:class I SAM-dependent methyltransferase [Solirubrobacteraceae bacterium]
MTPPDAAAGGHHHDPGGCAAADAFSAHADEYDASRRRLVPGYDDFYGAAVDVVRSVRGPVRRVLDLGAGTGLLSAEMARAFPGAELELLDASEPMLRHARDRLGDTLAAVHVADMTDPLPAGPYDAIVSALAVHHLEHPAQRRLFSAVHERLRPGGVFVNAEQVTTAVPQLERAYTDAWWRGCRALGASESELSDTRRRMLHDRCADVASLLRWLTEAGFGAVDCVYKTWQLAVVAGFKEET